MTGRVLIVPAQIRAARALLDWSQEKLAVAAKVGLSTVRDIEGLKRNKELGGLTSLVQALENAGVAFIGSDGDFGPGVRLLANQPNVIRAPTGVLSGILDFVVEWRGKKVTVCVDEDWLHDHPGGHAADDAEFVARFEKNRRKILDAASAAIDSGKVQRDGRLYLTANDLPG